MSLTTQNKEERACGAGISNDKLWNPKCNFFALLFGFAVIQIRASSSHSYACSLSGTHICPSALSCMCFHYFDLFNMCDEGKVSRMLFCVLWTAWLCVSGCMWAYARVPRLETASMCWVRRPCMQACNFTFWISAFSFIVFQTRGLGMSCSEWARLALVFCS